LGFHPAYRSEFPSPDFEYSSMAHPHSYFHPANMHGPRTRPPTTPSIESRGYMNHMYHMSPNPPPATPLPPTPDQTSFYDDPTRRPSLRLTSSMPTMTEANEALPKPPGSVRDDDTQTISNVSQTSSDRRRAEKVKANSEVRIRGRGGVQNIGKKEKDKEEKKEKKEEGKSRRLRFPTGSALAGIRGFH